jgi:hypothetical protein
MALLGQASGGFTESNSALRILHVGVRNTVTQLVADAFTQTNPPVVATNVTTASGFSSTVFGVLSGSIAFSRPDAGVVGGIGGPTDGGDSTERPLGIFINTANGLAFTNQPGVASNRGPYVSAQGTYANKLYETKLIGIDADLGGAAGTALTYIIGDELVASLNGYLTKSLAATNAHDVAISSGPAAAAAAWTIGIVTIAPDSNLDELVYDQRI